MKRTGKSGQEELIEKVGLMVNVLISGLSYLSLNDLERLLRFDL